MKKPKKYPEKRPPIHDGVWRSDDFHPGRRWIREQIRPAPPSFRERLGAFWKRLKPRVLANAEALRRNELLAFTVIVLVFLLAFLPGYRHKKLEEARQSQRRAELRAMAVAAIDDILGAIGHDVWVLGPELERPQYFVGAYRPAHNQLILNIDIDWSEEYLLAVVGHECVHALFDQAGLSGYMVSLEHQIVEETAAEILGAHLAGRVLSARGGNGSELTRGLVEWHRLQCWKDSDLSARSLFLRRIETHNEGKIDWREYWLVMNHFSEVKLVDEINQICTTVPDPWEAAHAIAEKYKLHLRWNPAAIPTPRPFLPRDHPALKNSGT